VKKGQHHLSLVALLLHFVDINSDFITAVAKLNDRLLFLKFNFDHPTMDKDTIYRLLETRIRNYRVRLGVVGLMLAAFILVFPIVYRQAGPPAGALITVVVLISSILLGMQVGFIVWVLTVPLFIILVSLSGSNGVEAARQNWPGIAATFVLSLLAGYLKNIISRMWHSHESAMRLNEKRLTEINNCFLSFDGNPEKNIKQLTSLAGELLGADYALYCKSVNGNFKTILFRGAEELEVSANPSQRALCRTFPHPTSGEVEIIRDCQSMAYGDMMASIGLPHVRTFAGKTVWINQKQVGTLCVLYASDPVLGMADQDIFGILASAIAVEEKREQTEKISFANEEKFRRVVESSPMGKHFYRLDDNERLILVGANPSAERIIGFSHRNMLGATIEEAFPSLVNTGVPALYRKVATGELGSQSFELPYRDDHTSAFYDVVVFPIGPNNIAVDFIDITARKKMEEAIRESEARFRSLYENSAIGLYRTAPDGTVVLANPTLVKMLGYSSFEELAALNLEEGGFVPSDERKRFKEHISIHGEVQNLESVWTRKDESIIHVNESARPLCDADGKILFFDGIVEDITERKRLEAQLLQAQKLEGVGTLAGGIAHDFNNILAMVLGSAELLQHLVLEQPELKKYVDRIIEASERGASISRQLLIFSRPDQAKLMPISLSHTISELQNLLRHFLPKSISIETSMDVEHGIIIGDSGQIHQALLNLALNAGDAMTKTGILTIREFTVSSEFIQNRFSVESSVAYVAVSVSDTGMGMDEAMIPKIFDPFFTTKERGKGTGLGLAMVHGIVKNHKGFIDVKSTPGVGSTFTLYFPAFMQLEEIPPTEARPPLQNHNELILLVDDEEHLREMLTEYLSDAGYRVLIASNGSEALELFRTNHGSIDLVITDLGMPQMGGEELFIKMKKIAPEVKVIVTSGYLDGVTKEHLLHLGIKDVLTKPSKLQEMQKVIRTVLGGM
jgi:PAS domain S-box-containing protein